MIPPSPDLERRSAWEIRAVGDRIVGHAIVFDSRSRDLGGFVEVVKSQAVDRSLAGDVVALFNHDQGAVLGRTPTTLRLTKDTRGLAFELHPPATQAGREALELVSRGDIRGASFGFKTIADAWSRDGGTMVRTLLDLELVEISLVAVPVYTATDVAIAQRSLQAFQAQQKVRARTFPIRWLRMRHHL